MECRAGHLSSSSPSPAIALLAAACSGTASDSSSTTAPTSSTSTTTTIPSDEICKIGDLRFGDEGLVAALGEDVGDANTISSIRWEGSSTCERLTVAFASSSGAPASSLGPTGVSVLAFAGVVRVQLPPELDSTAVADMLAEGDLVHRVFVVRSMDGSLSIDIHANRAEGGLWHEHSRPDPPQRWSSTSQLPTSSSAPSGAATSPIAIVMTPSPGPALYPLSIEGYAAPGADRLEVEFDGADDSTMNRTISLVGFNDAWQGFTSVITDGPSRRSHPVRRNLRTRRRPGRRRGRSPRPSLGRDYGLRISDCGPEPSNRGF